MNYLDYIILVVLAVGFILGFKDGLVRKIIGLIGFIVAVFVAFKFYSKLGRVITPFFNNDEYLSSMIAGVVIFLAILLIASLIKRVVHPFDKVNKFINQFLGGIIGAVQIIYFLSAVFLFLNIFSIPARQQASASFSYNFVLNIIPKSVDLLAGKNSKASDYLIKYIENKDEDPNPKLDSSKNKK